MPNLKPRPPIVAVLGHVDHGKTSLLDKIRNTNVVSREAGGITQATAAWQVNWPPEGDNSSRATGASRGIYNRITFIDTPGHEAFNNMRQRGAKVADIAILVVAADDGVMPQTKESIEYLKVAKTPFVVAITKTDLASAEVENVRNGLAQEGVLLEGRGGETVAVEVSSVTGKGIPELLDMILLLAELNEVRSDAEAPAEAVVLETQLDRRAGPVISCIVRNGTLKVGDTIGTEGKIAKVRGLFDQDGKPVKEATPGMPVQLLGFSELPPVGSVLTSGAESSAQAPVGPRTDLTRKKEGFWIVLKVDTNGSLEAIGAQLSREVGILSSGVGDITENDITRAQAADVPVVGFNVRAGKDIQKLADEVGVKVYSYRIIYELLQDVDKWEKEMAEAGREKILGKAEIIAQFEHGKERIAGAKLVEGRITKNDRLRLVRAGEVLGTIHPKSLKKQKEEVDKVDTGEFGIYFEPQLDFRIGDTIEAFIPPKVS